MNREEKREIRKSRKYPKEVIEIIQKMVKRGVKHFGQPFWFITLGTNEGIDPDLTFCLRGVSGVGSFLRNNYPRHSVELCGRIEGECDILKIGKGVEQ